MAHLQRTNTPQEREAAIAAAVEALRAGAVVAIPTETVYGLAANALDPKAVERIYTVKGRPGHNPIIVHVASAEMARACARGWPETADRLANAFWPGPLTLVLPKALIVPDIVTAGGDTVGIRWPNHPLTQEIIRRCGFPLAAPSANPSGRISPTTAEHVERSLGARIPLIIDGGPSEIGLESTVLDISVAPAQLLRPGMIHAESLAAVLGEVRTSPGQESSTLRSPGLLLKHYSPKARFWVWDKDETELKRALERAGIPLDRVYYLGWSRVPSVPFGGVSLLAREAHAFARALYAELHQADEARPDLIVLEEVPEGPEWSAVRDRLRRAAAD